MTFLYDNDPGTLRIVPRAVQPLDYTFGGPAYKPAQAASDRGESDEIHGEGGDDFIYGMKGNDVLFGEGQDDDLIGGYGDDWISGGTGDDGVIGDDGRISTSRNSSQGWTWSNATATWVPCTGTCYSEPLNGVLALLPSDPDVRNSDGNVLNELIFTPGQVQESLINVGGALNKSINLTPFNVSPLGDIDTLFDANGYDDIIFGGLGNDWLHGGSGDDAISGAEAMPKSYVQVYEGTCQQDTPLDDCVDRLMRLDYGHPWNDGDTLHFGADTNPWHSNGHTQSRLGEFLLYNEYDPRRAILFFDDGKVWRCTATIHGGHDCSELGGDAPTRNQYFLNFSSEEGQVINGCVETSPSGSTCLRRADAWSDGDDVIFGDLGNDWLVGGTGKDTLWGGWGNDLMNADDVLSTGCAYDVNGGKCGSPEPTWLNDAPDTHPTYEDRVFGGAGLDILIGNTGGDRLIDWIGEFNSYIVPFAPFGIATVSRQVPPALFEYLYALSKAQGADPTRAADNNASLAPRNGEPYGETGLITQRDHGLWQQQAGGPTDPQAGNIPGGQRDVLRTANFNDGTTTGFAPDSGVWEVAGATLQVSAASLGKDAASVLYVDHVLPVYYELLAQVLIQKPTAGWGANAYVIFDYFSPTDFKFAGIDAALNKAVLGHRTAQGWVIDATGVVTGNVRSDTYYDVQVVVNGLVVTVLVNGVNVLDKQLAPRWIDGVPYGFNLGLVGVGSNNSRGTYDNVTVQALPPETSLENTEDFADGIADLFTSMSSGTWAVTSGRFSGTPSGAAAAISLMTLPARAVGDTTVTLETLVRATSGGGGGLVFDHYSETDFKFATLDLAAGAVVVGHLIRNQWVEDARFVTPLAAGVDYKLSLTLNGTAVTVTLNGAVLGSFSYFGAVADGGLGAISRTGTTSFDDVHVAIGVHVSNSPDPTAPTITVPANLTRSTDAGQPTAFVSDSALGTATATDNVPGVLVTRSGVPAGNLFTIGVTTITWTATDVFGNQTTKTQTVTVTDNQAPSLTAPPNVARTVPAGTTSIVLTDAELGSATVSDNSGSVTVVRTGVPAGNVFALGTTTITYTATDASGNTTVRTQTVTVSPASPTVTVGATDSSGAEQLRDPLVFTVSTGTPLQSTLVVNLAWSGTATYGTDYTVTVTGGTLSPNGTTLTLAAGSTGATITIAPVDDSAAEPTETVTLTANVGSGYVVGNPASASGSIADNDSPSTITVTAADASGAEAGSNPISFTVTRGGNLATTIVINLGWSGTATRVSDYTISATGATLSANGLTLTFAPGAASATVTLSPVDDALAEGSETAILAALAGSGYTLGSPASASGSIADNDVAMISIDDRQVTEANTGTTAIAITVRLSAAATSTVTVTATTVAGTALAGSDYQHRSATVTFAAGTTTATFTVNIVNNRTVEPTETFTVVLSSPVGATIADGTAVVTIVDNDGALTAATAPTDAVAAELTEDELDAALTRARAQWGADLPAITASIADLPDLMLAQTYGSTIVVDRSAAGLGWSHSGGETDLLTVLLHELGHVAGLEHEDDGLMAPMLAAGERRVLTGTPAVETAAKTEASQILRAPLRAWIDGPRPPSRIASPAPQRLRAHRAATLRPWASRPRA